MVDEAKLRGPIRSTSEALVVQCGSGTLVGRNWAPPLLTNACCRHFSFQCVSSLPSTLLRCNSFPGIQKAVGDQTGSRPPNRGHDLFWCKSGFGKHFGASSLSNH